VRMAELSTAEKNRVSHRARAAEKARVFLAEIVARQDAKHET
jgi:inosine/xanthosine triphosphate pyrophosphatase family protein